MPIENVSARRRTVAVAKKVTVATTSTSLVDERPDRVALIVSCGESNLFTLSLASSATLKDGITLYAGGAPLILTLAEHGELVIRAWTAIAKTASEEVGVTEVLAQG
jgi:hypothetical protein